MRTVPPENGVGRDRRTGPARCRAPDVGQAQATVVQSPGAGLVVVFAAGVAAVPVLVGV